MDNSTMMTQQSVSCSIFYTYRLFKEHIPQLKKKIAPLFKTETQDNSE